MDELFQIAPHVSKNVYQMLPNVLLLKSVERYQTDVHEEQYIVDDVLYEHLVAITPV